MKFGIMTLAIVFSLIFTSCELTDHEYDCEAIVTGNVDKNAISCTKEVWELKITQGIDIVQSMQTEKIDYADSIYSVLNLPDELKTEGKAIKLDIRKPSDDEIPSCYNFEMPVAMGTMLYIVRAEEK